MGQSDSAPAVPVAVSGADRARQALGARLRELRKDAGLSGRELSASAGWHWTKTSRIELGKRPPSEADIEAWCRVCGAELALPDLLAARRNVEAQWAEWKRVVAAGRTGRQRRGVESKCFSVSRVPIALRAPRQSWLPLPESSVTPLIGGFRVSLLLRRCWCRRILMEP
ncbi:helix-turn-helix domain-containing protein [Nocardia sp. NBC_01499]|uniref:helix-turn-helix domain-containing protein n=1 Tax=Nocardia sp. NBC_01499 TaxID=2903597 RepID=UPI00386CB88A